MYANEIIYYRPGKPSKKILWSSQKPMQLKDACRVLRCQGNTYTDLVVSVRTLGEKNIEIKRLSIKQDRA